MKSKNNSQPTWHEQQWRISGNWEPKMFLYRRGDGTFCDVESLWAATHSDSDIDRMKKLGVNLSHIHFHKGYGLDAEKESIQEATRWAEKLHEHDIRVGVYIGSTFFSETFQHRDHKKMIMKNEQVGWNAAQYFREYWCYNSRESIDYFKEVIRIAVEQVKADVLHFDGSFAFYHDQLCHCEDCLRLFREFLRDDMPELVRAAGYERADDLQPPPCGNREYIADVSSMKEPGDIAWTLFHAKAGYRALKELSDYARSIAPGIAILYNGANLCGITSYSRPDMELAKIELVDMTCVEDEIENPVRLSDDGVVISRFRAYKAGYRNHTRVCYYTTTEGSRNRLMLAEAAAFNYRCLGFVETVMQHNHRLHDKNDKAILRYLIDNEELFLAGQQWHNVAVVRDHASEILNPFPCALSPYVVEQVLFEHHHPFAIISGEQLGQGTPAEQFDLVVLPDSRCLSDHQIDQLEAFVSNGGALLAIGNTGQADEINQYRDKWGLSNIFGTDKDPFDTLHSYDETADSSTTSDTEHRQQDGRLEASFGKGRAIWLERLDFQLPDSSRLNRFGGYHWYYHPYWKPPRNSRQVISAAEELLDTRWLFRATLPRHVAVESYHTDHGYTFHLVNYDEPNTISGGTIILNIANIQNAPTELRWQQPGETRALQAKHTAEGHLTIELPEFSLLATLSITQ